jgi:manganese/iron transport system ATP-binding protein
MGSKKSGGGLTVQNATVTYRNGHTALRNASFSIPRGTITALVGVNGAGKSTIFKAIMGFVPLAAGSVSIFDLPVKEALRKNLVAYVPQAEEVDWSFPVLVEDVVMMGRYGHMNFLRIPSKRDHQMVEEALGRVNMLDYRKRQIGELSGGQKKRVFLARALAQEGQVILLDEPFTGVDVTTEEQIVVLLKALRDEGRVMVLASGKTADTFNEENLQKAFGGSLRHFVLGGAELHDDADPRRLKVITDDERPFVIYGKNGQNGYEAKPPKEKTDDKQPS